MESAKIYSSFKMPDNASLRHTESNTPVSNAIDRPDKDVKTKYAASAAAAIGIAALAIAAIKLGPKVLKGRKIMPTGASGVQNNLPRQINNPADVLPNDKGTGFNAVEFLKDRLSLMYEGKAELNFDNLAQAEVLKSGSKRYAYEFKDNSGALHSFKLLSDKDGEFLSLFEKTVDTDGSIIRAKYSKDSVIPIFSTNANKEGTCIINSYNIDGISYHKTIKRHPDGTVEEALGKGILGNIPISKTKTVKNANGEKIKFVTDLTGDSPVEYIRISGAGHPQYAVLPSGQHGKITVYKLDSKGRILSQSTEKMQDYIWDVKAPRLNVSDTPDMVPAYSYGGNLDRDFKRIPRDKNETRKFVSESAKMDYNTDLFGDFSDRYYDVPERFAIIANNIADKNGSALVCDNIPAIFKGIDTSEIQKALDNFSALKDYKVPVYEFEIAGKKFRAAYVGGGQIGNVYKLQDEAGNTAALKIFRDQFLLGAQSGYSEIPLSRQMSKEGVKDVPKFFMANPVGKPVCVNGDCAYTGHGGWMLSEFIESSTPQKQEGITFSQWLKKHNLVFGDYNAGTKAGDYIVDIGGVTSKKSIDSETYSVLDELDNRLLTTIHNGTSVEKLLSI